jgi:hypothetical protein
LGPLENQQIDLTSNRLYLNTDELAEHLNALYDITILTALTSRLIGLFLIIKLQMNLQSNHAWEYESSNIQIHRWNKLA